MKFTLDQIAHVCHEANRALQIELQEPPSPHFPEAPEWMVASAVAGVQAAQRGATPEQLHASWSELKRSEGWVYGPVKDFEAKTHPCLVPYAELPDAQRAKDVLFGAVVRALSGAE
jgi:hypothetical protein